MTISTRLRMAASVPAGMAVMLVVALLFSFGSVADLRRDQAAAIRIRSDLVDMDLVVRSYLLHHDSAGRVRYMLKDQELKKRLRSVSDDSHYRAHAFAVTNDAESMRSLFNRIIENDRVAGLGTHDAITARAEERLATQLFIRSRDANNAAADLVRGITDDITNTQRRIYLLTTIFTVGAAVVLTAALLALVRNINASLAALTTGTESVGAGQLDYRMRLDTQDELGELSRSFDRMTENLEDVTVSKERLEREVAERSRVEDELRRSAATTRSLLDAAIAMSTWTDIEELLGGLARVLLDLTSHSRVTVSLWDERHRELRIAASTGEEPLEPVVLPFDTLSEDLQCVITEGRAHVSDYDAAETASRGVAQKYRLHLALQVPLKYRDRVVGVIGIDDPDGRRRFTADEVEVIEGIASQAAVAIENARLFEASLGQLARTTVLKEAATAAQALDPFELSRNVLESFKRLLGIRAATVYLLDADEHVLRNLALYGYPEDVATEFEVVEVGRDTVSGIAVLEDRMGTYGFDDLPKGTRERAQRAGEQDSVWAVVPVHVHGRVIGNITLVFPSDRRFTDEDMGLFASLADQFGIALENARLYVVERRIADRLQEALLSLPDRVDGIEFAHMYHSATEQARVGGDFYDVFHIEHDLIGITIGDVAGKGLDAAVLTSLVKNTIRAHANDGARAPATVLAKTNSLVYKSTPSDSFVTVFYAVLDCGSGALTYSNAGHTTGAAISDSGGVARLQSTGPILGAFPDVGFGHAEIALSPAQTLFVYTDGLTEARREHELYGEERLFALLAEKPGGQPGDLLRRVLDDVFDFAGGSLSDDLALLAVRRSTTAAGDVPSHRSEVSF